MLQFMTYLSGLSGGSWPVMSLATHNFPGINEMVKLSPSYHHIRHSLIAPNNFQVALWATQQSTLNSPNNTAHRADAKTLFKEIYPKFAAGYNVSWSDFQGRGFSWEFVVRELDLGFSLGASQVTDIPRLGLTVVW